MKKSIYSYLVFVLVLASCGGDNGSISSPSTPAPAGPVKENSVDSQGNCTSSFRTDYNNVGHELTRLDLAITANSSDTKIIKQAVVLGNACDQFYANHLPDISCIATVDYKDKSVSSADMKSICDEGKRILNLLENKNTQSDQSQ